MDKPPPIIGSAKVLAYATVDASVEWAGPGRIFVGPASGPLEPLGRVPKLAICKFPYRDDYDLFYCDDDWNVQGGTAYPTFEEVKNRAEKDYPGISQNWRSFVHEDEAAVDRACMEPFCAGCGKSWIELYELKLGGMFEVEGQFFCEICHRG